MTSLPELEPLGLGRYSELFAAHGIDVDVLADLTDGDLEKLGLAIGDRRRILKAAQNLKTVEALAASTPSPAREAERRQLTVMFVDLVGSTALSERLDPEEMRDVLRAYQNTVTGEISRLEGFTAKLMGDGVLAYFGWPRTHEDEAERAVRAGLAVVAAVGRLPMAAGEPLAARVGIATGLVVVGDLVGEGAAQEQAVVGDTPNLAARLQAAAEPGMVVIAEATRRLLGDLFEMRELGAQSLKGIQEKRVRLRSARRAGVGEPVRRAPVRRRGADRRPRPGTRPAARALAAGDGRRRSGGAAHRRSRNRQVAHQRGPGRGGRRRAALPAALPMLALSRGFHALSRGPTARPCRALFRATTMSNGGWRSSRRCLRRPAIMAPPQRRCSRRFSVSTGRRATARRPSPRSSAAAARSPP